MSARCTSQQFFIVRDRIFNRNDKLRGISEKSMQISSGPAMRFSVNQFQMFLDG